MPHCEPPVPQWNLRETLGLESKFQQLARSRDSLSAVSFRKGRDWERAVRPTSRVVRRQPTLEHLPVNGKALVMASALCASNVLRSLLEDRGGDATRILGHYVQGPEFRLVSDGVAYTYSDMASKVLPGLKDA